MENRYLIVDGGRGGTGIRDQYEGFIDPHTLALSKSTISKLEQWLSDYHTQIDLAYNFDTSEISSIDLEGLKLLHQISGELGHEYKIRYYSDIRMKELILKENQEIIEV